MNDKKKIFSHIFKRGSKTYFYSSIFFPKDVRDDVFILYAFVRTADDFVDAQPQDKNGFHAFIKQYQQATGGQKTDNPVIDAYTHLSARHAFDPNWTHAFLQAMEQDLTKKIYKTLHETEEYMYGSAEVIGLMMAAILKLPKKSYTAAQLLGKAMQYINFIRDVKEDIELGRTYLPTSELQKVGLAELSQQEALTKPSEFKSFIQNQLLYYEGWQRKAEEGFRYIPRRYRIPIQTASDMYRYTASRIHKNPFIIFEKKVKPTKLQIITAGIKNSIL